MKLELKGLAGLAAFASLTVAITGAAAMAQTVTALPSVDLNRFKGSWYEIARLPGKREKACIADVVDLVASGDRKNDLQLVSSCKAKDAYEDVWSADIKAEKNSGGGKLKVTYIWPFSEKEWVLGLDGDYQWALLGSPIGRRCGFFQGSAS